MVLVETEADTAREEALEVLNGAFSRRYNSIAQYILDARPYVRPEDEPLRRLIAEIAAFDASETGRLAEVIEAMEGIPKIVPYPHDVAELNYLSLAHLGRVLRERLEIEEKLYEDLMPRIRDCQAAFDAINALRLALAREIDGLAAMSKESNR